MKHFRLSVAMLSVFLAWGCSVQVTDNGGGSSTTTNSFAMLVDSSKISGTTSPGTEVMIFSSEYQPVFRETFFDSTICAADGVFTFPNLPQGFYCILARSTTHSLAKYVGIISVPPRNGSLKSLNDSLTGTQVIKGTVHFSSLAAANSGATVAILGTPFYCFTDSTGTFSLTGVPEGNYLVQATEGRGAVLPILKFISASENDFAYVTVAGTFTPEPVSLTVR